MIGEANNTDEAHMATRRRNVQRRTAVVGLVVHVGASLEQLSDDFGVALLGGDAQRRRAATCPQPPRLGAEAAGESLLPPAEAAS